MRIFDAQLHAIGPWSEWTGETVEMQNQLLSELLVAYLDAAGVSGAVLFPVGDDAALRQVSSAKSDRFAFVPNMTPDGPDVDAAVRAVRAAHKDGIVGVRVVIGWPADGTEVRRFDAGVWDPVFAACERHAVPVFLFITGWLPRTADIAARFPRLTLIIDHLGLPQPPMEDADDPPFKALPDLLDLAKFPGVNIKLCGLPSLSQRGYPFGDVAPQLRSIVDAFGANRLMWASDINRFSGTIGIQRMQNPRSLGPYQGKHTYAESLFFIRESEVLTASEKADILGGTLQRVLGWPAAGPA